MESVYWTVKESVDCASGGWHEHATGIYSNIGYTYLYTARNLSSRADGKKHCSNHKSHAMETCVALDESRWKHKSLTTDIENLNYVVKFHVERPVEKNG